MPELFELATKSNFTGLLQDPISTVAELLILFDTDKLRKIKLKASLNHCLIDKTIEKPKNDIDFLIVVDVNKIIYEEILSKEDEKNKNEIVDPNYILEKIENIIKIDVTLLLT